MPLTTSHETQPLPKIALICSPRTGSQWLRAMLTRGLGLKQIGLHEVPEDAWASFAPGTLLGIHWLLEPDFAQKLNTHGFQVITLARHPLDCLLSILHFSLYEKETAKWLLGKGGDESTIWGAMPTSQSFLDYCRSERVKALLSVTLDWSRHPGVQCCRYEDLVANGPAELRRMASRWSETSVDWESIATSTDLNAMRKTRPGGVVTNHYWKGKVGNWRQYLTQNEVDQVAGALQPFLEAFGYETKADPQLTRGQAERNWIDSVGPSLSASLARLKELEFKYENPLAQAQPQHQSQPPQGPELPSSLGQPKSNFLGSHRLRGIRSWFQRS